MRYYEERTLRVFRGGSFRPCSARKSMAALDVAAAAAITYDDEEEETKRDDWHDTRGEFCRRGVSSV